MVREHVGELCARQVPVSPEGPVRTCVGCRQRAGKHNLVRIVAADGADGTGGPLAVPDPRGAAPGRGAHLHVDPGCLDLALRRRALPRALRSAGALDTRQVRDYVHRVAEHGPDGAEESTPDGCVT